MRVEIQLLNHYGWPLPKALRQQSAVYRDKLAILENRLNTYGRAVTSARLVSLTDGIAADLLPPLLDVHILWLDDDRMHMARKAVVYVRFAAPSGRSKLKGEGRQLAEPCLLQRLRRRQLATT
jgi:hypothetical protein